MKLLILTILILAMCGVPQSIAEESVAEESVAEERPVNAVSVSAAEMRSNKTVIDGRQYVSSGQPDQRVLEIVKDAGFVAVVDLRSDEEDRGMDEVRAVESLGMSYVLLPIDDADAVNFENARALDLILARFDGPVLVHCASGNRVGALFALRASLAGESDEESLLVGKAAGLTRLEPVVKKRLENRSNK